MKFFILLFGLINLFAVSVRASSYKNNKRVHDLVSTKEEQEKLVCDSLLVYFEAYQRPDFHARKPFDIDSIRLDDTLKEVRLYPNECFYSQLFNYDLLKKIYSDLSTFLPEEYADYKIQMFAKRDQPLEALVPNFMRSDSLDELRRWRTTSDIERAWVKPNNKTYSASRGLKGRHLMVWASHGRFYKNKVARWEWQRPYLFCTTEDLLTQSIVYPFLYPMLERAGAIIVSPRERDTQTEMVVVDNDSKTKQGKYYEKERDGNFWMTITEKPGFAPPVSVLTDGDQPFMRGTARSISTVRNKAQMGSTNWEPKFEKSGSYAVYVSYVSLPNSVEDAQYVVYHAGGISTYTINQKMGGGTWTYLGTFEFNSQTSQRQGVMLTNVSSGDGVVTADAVRFGGGVGLCEREGKRSFLPAHLEAARYYTQWAGLPEGECNTEGSENDYVDDLRCRSNFTNYLAGGSVYLPHQKGLGVPLELVTAIHTDAGHKTDNSVFGTLSISTTYDVASGENYPEGISRMASFDLAHMLAEGVARDLSKLLQTNWTRRETWNRNYSETRSPQIPSTILELLSHQNFTDMRYAHDPLVKFHIARSIYKSLLRYVNFQHRITDVVVQPLPVKDIWANLDSKANCVTLGWTPMLDPLEPSAMPSQYIVYTKIGNRGFDNGQIVADPSFTMAITPGVQYCFRVAALNDGGESFPSEEMTVYKAPNEQKRVMIVNGFTRLCGPAIVQKSDSVGFDLKQNIGIPWGSTSAISGAQVCFDPRFAGREGEGALGFSSNEWVGKNIAGNTFNFTTEHGRAMARTREYSFASASVGAVEQGSVVLSDYDVLDYIAGRQGEGAENLKSYKTFTPLLQQCIRQYASQGGNLLVTGSHLGSDMQTPEEQEFLASTMGFTYEGTVPADSCATLLGLNMKLPLYNQPNEVHYSVGHPDILKPSNKQGFSAFAYTMGKSAGVAYKADTHRAITIAVPFECIADEQYQDMAIRAMLNFLTQ